MYNLKLKLMKGNVGSKLLDISLGNIFLDLSPQTWGTKAKINYWDYIKIKSFCIVKEMINKTKRNQPTEWKKIFTNDISSKGSISEIYKKLIQLNKKTTSNPIKKWAADLSRHFFPKD